MAERHAFVRLIRTSRGDTIVLLATFLLTIFKDLTWGIVAGFILAALLFIDRMAKGAAVEPGKPGSLEDVKDAAAPYDAAVASDPDVVIYRISGAFFFAAASTVGAVLDRIGHHRALVIDFAEVSLLDSTAANAIAVVVADAARKDIAVYISGAQPYLRKTLRTYGVKEPVAAFHETIDEAYAEAKAALAGPTPAEL
jgi:SulP family sulfate permease